MIKAKEAKAITQSVELDQQILPKVGAPYYEGDQATCNVKK